MESRKIDPLSLAGIENMNSWAFIDSIREGLDGRAAKELTEDAGLTRAINAKIFRTDESNVARIFRRRALSSEQSEALLDTIKLIAYAIRVFGDKAIALDWLSTPVPALNGNKPYELIDTFEGRAMIKNVLTYIEFGEFT